VGDFTMEDITPEHLRAIAQGISLELNSQAGHVIKDACDRAAKLMEQQATGIAELQEKLEDLKETYGRLLEHNSAIHTELDNYRPDR